MITLFAADRIDFNGPGRPSWRRMALGLLAFAIVMLASQQVAAVEIVSLRQPLTVEGERITLGDLFDNAGEAAGVTIAQSPAPGQFVTLHIAQVLARAHVHGIHWPNPTGLRQLRVKRASLVIPGERVAQGIATELARQNGGDTFEVQFDARGFALHVALNETPDFVVETVRYDRVSGRFDAAVRAPANDVAARPERVTGRGFPILRVPVTAKALAPGDIIGESDIEWTERRRGSVSQGTILSLDAVIGQAARRGLRPGQALRHTDVQRPNLITRGALVDVVYRAPGIELVALAQALQDGAEGDVIQLRNMHTNRTVRGTVLKGGEIRVDPPFLRTADARAPARPIQRLSR